MNYEDIPPCEVCGEEFENVFELTDHLVEDGGEYEVFDPKLILPNGYSLMVGSLLRCLYSHADDPRQIRNITQSTYSTLYAAETNPEIIKDVIEDMVVAEHMFDIDDEIRDLLDDNESGA